MVDMKPELLDPSGIKLEVGQYDEVLTVQHLSHQEEEQTEKNTEPIYAQLTVFVEYEYKNHTFPVSTLLLYIHEHQNAVLSVKGQLSTVNGTVSQPSS